MNTGPIRPIPYSHVVDRSDERLPSAWIGGIDPPLRAARGAALTRETESPAAPPQGTTPVLVMLAGDHPAATRALLHAADAGARVYVLATPRWGEAKADPGLASRRRATVLIRRAPDIPATAILAGGIAWLWFGPSHTGPAPWRLGLDAHQAAALRQLFLRLFWHHAIDEAWTGAADLAFRPAGERPFDVPELPDAAPVRVLPGSPSLGAGPRGALVHITAGEPPTEGPKRLWFIPSGEHHPRLISLLRGGCEIVAGTLDLPDLFVAGNAGRALLSGTAHGRLAIDLNATQAADAARILGGESAWRFAANVRLGDHAAQSDLRFWLANASSAAPVQTDQPLPVGDLAADTLRAALTLCPTSWPTPQHLALRAVYSWQAVPPRLGAGSSEDPLVTRWRELDEDHARRIAQAREELTTADSHRGRVGKAFSRLMNAMLGFERAQKNIERTLSELERTRPSATGPSGAHDLLTKLTDAEKRVGQLRGDLAEAERKATLEDERAKQERAWKDAVETARRAVETCKSELTTCEEKVRELNTALAALEEELKTADSKQSKDLQARKKRDTDQRTGHEKRIRSLVTEIAGHEKRRDAPFEFNPPATTGSRAAPAGARFIPTSTTTPAPTPIPTEALPEVGALRVHKRQRYLAIERWEDLTTGEQAATRLQARLVSSEGP